MNMKKYSKLIGAVVGAGLGYLVSIGVLDAGFDVQGFNEQLMVVGLAVGTFFAPKNAD